MTCEFEINDGAYILGALAPAERAGFEHHLANCPQCRDSVAQLAVLPGLLGRLDPQLVTAGARCAAPTAPPELLPRVLTAARSQRRRQRWRQALVLATACVVAAALATAAGIGTRLVAGPDPTSTAVIRTGDPVVFTEMHSTDDTDQVVAHIGLHTEATSTIVEVRCLYHSQYPGTWPIWLVVFPRDAAAEAIGSWVASSDAEAAITAVTHYTVAQIERIELQDADKAPLAWWRPQ
jgi:predicted anti-sigma-YlaC factor YlaD